jgi:antitoxin (DNA-binding transcriptional repressor) of toxin-antitoxin stability system
MKTATLRDLRYSFSKIEAWLRAGEEVQITKHSKPLGRLLPESKVSKRKPMPPLPDFAARRKAIWGNRVFSNKEVDDMRAFETGEP